MTESEKLIMLQTLTGETNEDILRTFLILSGSKILKRRFPYGTKIKEVPEEYVDNQIEIAVYLYNKQGAEGQISHSENGISRSYESASVPESMLKGIVPYVGVLS